MKKKKKSYLHVRQKLNGISYILHCFDQQLIFAMKKMFMQFLHKIKRPIPMATREKKTSPQVIVQVFSNIHEHFSIKKVEDTLMLFHFF